MRNKLAYVLRKVGYEVFEAENGLQGLQQTTRIKPDLILLDLKMPNIDGFEVQRRIRESTSYRYIPIIFITSLGSISIEQINEALKHGINAFVTKPFKLDKLLSTIDDILNHEEEPSEPIARPK